MNPLLALLQDILNTADEKEIIKGKKSYLLSDPNIPIDVAVTHVRGRIDKLAAKAKAEKAAAKGL